MEEGVGESSSPPRTFSGAISPHRIARGICSRLIEIGHPEAFDDPLSFHASIAAHFARLPPSYALDMTVEKAEDALLHRNMLLEAKDPKKRPVFRARFVKAIEDQNLEQQEDARGIAEDHAVEGSTDGMFELHSLVHEIIFATVDKPKLLCQLSALLSDIGLNIREAHVFSTTNGYSLTVFVVDGWAAKETERLYVELESGIRRSEWSWYGSSHYATTKVPAVLECFDGEIDLDLLRFEERIGAGSCGDLYRGSYGDQEVAIKVLRPEHLNEKIESEFLQEVQILRKLEHANIIRFVGACTKLPRPCIVTEYMPGGNLYEFLRKQPTLLGLPLLLKFAIDVCKGMDYLHRSSIIHRDLKTANLLLDNNGVVKISDFGMARIQDTNGVMTAETGTYRWMAPEIINHQCYNEKADVFSFAVVLWELATSKLPYEGMTPVQAALGVREGRRPELPMNAHPRLIDLMQRCWEAIPTVRPSFMEITLELEKLFNQVSASADQHAYQKAPKRVKGENRRL